MNRPIGFGFMVGCQVFGRQFQNTDVLQHVCTVFFLPFSNYVSPLTDFEIFYRSTAKRNDNFRIPQIEFAFTPPQT